MKSEWLTRTLYKNALAKGKVYMSANNHTRNGITEYNLYIKTKNGMMRVVGHSPYWSDNKCAYWVTAWGTSRPLEVILSVGSSLGLKFHEIKQNWTFI